MPGDRLNAQDYGTGLDLIDRHPWFVAVGAEIQTPVPCDGLEGFDELDSEMMKRGTLAQNNIRWDWVAEQSAALLREKCKDLRLLAFLVHAVPRCEGDVEALALTAAVTARFLLRWGSIAEPRGKQATAQLARIVDTLEQQTEKVRNRPFDEALRAVIAAALHRCAETIAETAPDLGIRLAVLPSKLEAFETPSKSREGATRSNAPSPPQSHPKPPATGSIPAAPRSENLHLDAGNERALKQALATVADFLLSLDPAHPLSYRLRRFATWYGVASTPPIKSGERTVAPAVSESTAETYRIAAERGQADIGIAQKLERSTHLQPFWIEGQWLAWRLANACGRTLVADAIHAETFRFTRAVPDVCALKFADGAALVPPHVADWLASGGEEKAPAKNRGGDGDAGANDAVRSAREKAQTGELAEALKALDAAKPQTKGVRAGVLWEVQVLEALSDWGLKAHASLQAERIATSVETLTVPEWEPDLIERLKRLRT